jgi:hypothetical protein
LPSSYVKKIVERVRASKDEKRKMKAKFQVGMESWQEKIQALQASRDALLVSHKREEQLFQACFYNLGREMTPGLLQESATNRQQRGGVGGFNGSGSVGGVGVGTAAGSDGGGVGGTVGGLTGTPGALAGGTAAGGGGGGSTWLSRKRFELTR